MELIIDNNYFFEFKKISQITDIINIPYIKENILQKDYKYMELFTLFSKAYSKMRIIPVDPQFRYGKFDFMDFNAGKVVNNTDVYNDISLIFLICLHILYTNCNPIKIHENVLRNIVRIDKYFNVEFDITAFNAFTHYVEREYSKKIEILLNK